jgi:phage tail-like protein
MAELDPHKNFKFRVKWDGKVVAGVSKVSPLRRVTEVVDHREGSTPSMSRKGPGLTKYEPITLERGITSDTAFEAWANLVFTLGAPGSGTADFRKDIVLELLNETGQVVAAYRVHRCWISEYQALPTLDGDSRMVAIEHIKLENEGWERDLSIVPPTK